MSTRADEGKHAKLAGALKPVSVHFTVEVMGTASDHQYEEAMSMLLMSGTVPLLDHELVQPNEDFVLEILRAAVFQAKWESKMFADRAAIMDQRMAELREQFKAHAAEVKRVDGDDQTPAD